MHHFNIKAFWQQVMDLLKETFYVFIELNIRNTVFSTNVEELLRTVFSNKILNPLM